MKPIFFAGATLMAGAVIYGLISYEKTNSSKEFKTMYETPKTKAPAPGDVETAPVVPSEKEMFLLPAKKEIAASLTKTQKTEIKKPRKSRSRKLNYKLFSRESLVTESGQEILIPPVDSADKKY